MGHCIFLDLLKIFAWAISITMFLCFVLAIVCGIAIVLLIIFTKNEEKDMGIRDEDYVLVCSVCLKKIDTLKEQFRFNAKNETLCLKCYRETEENNT